MVEQPEYGKNTPYFVDFIEIPLRTRLLNLEDIRDLYLKQGLSAVQIGRRYGVVKSVILARLHQMGVRLGTGAGRLTNPENYRNRTAPYGFSVKGGKLVINKREIKVCRAVAELMGRQGFSATATAKELGRRGYKNRLGRSQWDHSSVINIFERWKDKL